MGAAVEGVPETVDLSTIGPLQLSLVSVEALVGAAVSVLLEVTSEPGTRANTPGLTTIDGWPIRRGLWLMLGLCEIMMPARIDQAFLSF